VKIQLRYFQEDVIRWLSIIATILAFGCDFKVLGWTLAIYTVGQHFYARYWYKKMEKEEK